MEMGRMVSGARRFVFQQFVPGDTLDPGFRSVEPFSVDVIEGFGELMEGFVARSSFESSQRTTV